MKNDNKSIWIQNLFDFKSQYAQINWFFLMWGVCFGVGYLFRGIDISISFWISELNQKFITSFSLKDIIDLIFLNLIYPFISIKTRNLIINDKNKNKFFPKPIDENNIGLISLKNYFFIFFLVVFIFANTSHILFNRINSGVRHINPDIIYTNVYRIIYFFDEYFGHLGLSIGFLGMATINLNDQISIKCRKLNIFEKIWLYLFGISFGSVFAATLMEGQSAFPILLYYVGVLIYLVKYVIKHIKLNKINIRNLEKWNLIDYPIIIFFILNSIGFIGFSLIYGALTGLKPYYPFFIQIGGDYF